eukprot:1948932-Rhodomonas_salina.3
MTHKHTRRTIDSAGTISPTRTQGIPHAASVQQDLAAMNYHRGRRAVWGYLVGQGHDVGDQTKEVEPDG